MNRSFYRCWLPLSVVLHLLVLALLQLTTRTITPASGEMVQEITVLPAPETGKPILRERVLRDRQPKPILRERQPRALPLPPLRPPVEKSERLGIAHPRSTNGISTSDIVVKRPGTGHKLTAPAKVLTTPASRWASAPGLDTGTGAAGTELGAGAANYGAAALGGPNPAYPKLAEERGAEGTVVVRVSVSAAGVVTSPVVVHPSGDPDLDDAGVTAATHWRFTPAKKNGKPVASTMRLRFHFAHGAVTGAVEGH